MPLDATRVAIAEVAELQARILGASADGDRGGSRDRRGRAGASPHGACAGGSAWCSTVSTLVLIPAVPPVFHATAPPSDQDIADIVVTVRVKTLRLLQRRGLAPTQPAGEVVDPLAEEAPLLAACYGASVQGTVALVPGPDTT